MARDLWGESENTVPCCAAHLSRCLLSTYRMPGDAQMSEVKSHTEAHIQFQSHKVKAGK